MIQSNFNEKKYWDLMELKSWDDKNQRLKRGVLLVVTELLTGTGNDEKYIELDLEQFKQLERIVEQLRRQIDNFKLNYIVLEEDFDIWKKGMRLYYYDIPANMNFILGQCDGDYVFFNFKKFSYKEVYENPILKKIYDYFNPSYSFRII